MSDSNYKHDVFISYASERKACAGALHDQWTKCGLRVFYDRNLRPSVSYPSALFAELQASKFLVVLISPEVATSSWVGDEVDNWMHHHNGAQDIFQIAIVPGLGDTVLPRIGHLQRIELNGGNDSKEAYRRLLGELGARNTDVDPPSFCFYHENGDSPPSRRATLASLAYSFLLLDQLPSGGWGRSLATWMESIMEGGHTRVPVNPHTRERGGTDLTCYAFFHLVEFLRQRFSTNSTAQIHLGARISDIVRSNMDKKIGYEGGIGVGHPTRGKTTELRLRHTALGMITFILCGRVTNHQVRTTEQLKRTTTYLQRKLRDWDKDKSHRFGMYASFVKLLELLETSAKIPGVGNPKALAQALREVLPGIADYILNEASYEISPQESFTVTHSPFPFFIPYFNYWRMERSNFLMHLPFCVQQNGEFHEVVDQNLITRFKPCLDVLLKDVATPFSEEAPGASLIRFHDALNDADAREVRRDWGLSAELAAVLRLPAIRGLYEDTTERPLFFEREQALYKALVETFDKYSRYRQLFHFTHGVSMGRWLNLTSEIDLSQAQIVKLDEAVRTAGHPCVTESALNQLLSENGTEGDQPFESRGVLNLLVNKLESGEYPPKEEADRAAWEQRVDQAVNATIDFFEGPRGLAYAKHYSKPIRLFVGQLKEIAGWQSPQGRAALDVGCGPGQYARVLANKGYRVTLIDASQQMLDIAKEKLKSKNRGRALSGEDTGNSVAQLQDIRQWQPFVNKHAESFDVVFACAIMPHVPKSHAATLYKQFHKLLRPEGILFVNYKLGDHSMISLDGRFYEYYRDSQVPLAMLEQAGFEIEQSITKYNRRNMYGVQTKIEWLNIFARRGG